MRPWQPAPVEGWLQRVTTGNAWRLAGALLIAPLGAGLAGLLFDAGVVLLIERDTLHDITLYHGAKPIWFSVLAVIAAPVVVAGLLATHLALATLRLRSLWAYLAIAALAGLAFTWELQQAWSSCPTGMQGACPTLPEGQRTRVLLGDMAMALAPAIGATLTFWAVLRPGRPRGAVTLPPPRPPGPGPAPR